MEGKRNSPNGRGELPVVPPGSHLGSLLVLGADVLLEIPAPLDAGAGHWSIVTGAIAPALFDDEAVVTT